jgi:hypothetical protein
MTFLEFLGVSRDTISLLEELRGLLQSVEGDSDANLRQTLLSLRGSAIGVAERLRTRLGAVLNGLNDLGVNLDLPEQQAADQFRRNASLLKKAQFNQLTGEIDRLRSEVSGFVADVEAILLCAGRNTTIGETATNAYSVRTQLYQQSLNNAPLHDHLALMLDTVMGIAKNLG